MTGFGENESQLKHTERVKIEPNSDEYDETFTSEEHLESQLDINNRELKKEEGPFIMTTQRNSSGEMESPPKHTKIIKIEPNSDECDSSFIKNVGGSKLSNLNFVAIGIVHQKNDKQLTSENLSKTRSVQIDDSLNSAQMGMEMEAARQSKDFFACSICSYRAHKVSEMEKHSLSHSGENPSCDISHSLKSGGTPVAEPNIIYRIEKDLFSTYCSYRTSQSCHIKSHIDEVTPTGEKPFSCELCSFKATHKGQLNRHILTHTGEKPFSCELCSFKTTHAGNLNQHILTHSAEKPFSCQLCSFKTCHHRSLNQHILTHSGEKTFSCRLCSFKTSHKRSLDRHILNHTGEKPFSCNICSFKTAHKRSLDRHILTHTGEKPFSCDICSFKTSHYRSLNQHILTHTGEKPFSCKHCPFKTSHKRSLNRHILTHTERSPPDEVSSLKHSEISVNDRRSHPKTLTELDSDFTLTEGFPFA